MKAKIKQIIDKRRKPTGDSTAASVPRITNDTVAAHREEVLSSARKYIYPLQHSKHKVVLISVALFIALLVVFLTYCTVALYRLQSTSAFLYRVTQVVPFPVARAGSDFVAYENYLFELRHYMYYYENQQQLDFNSEAGSEQLNEYKKRALEKVINDAYVKKLAEQNNVEVTDQELDKQITVARNQSRFGATQQSLEDTLRINFGWTLDDFKRSLRQQMLAQKVVAAMDTETVKRANDALAEIRSGAPFEEVAKKYSDDEATKENGGDFGIMVDPTNRDLTVQTTEALFSLKPGEVSEVINIGYALEIVKNLESQNDKIRGAHIIFNFKDINTYINDLKDKETTRQYITP